MHHWGIRGGSWWIGVAGGGGMEFRSREGEQCGLGLVSGPGSDLSWLESELQLLQDKGWRTAQPPVEDNSSGAAE